MNEKQERLKQYWDDVNRKLKGEETRSAHIRGIYALGWAEQEPVIFDWEGFKAIPGVDTMDYNLTAILIFPCSLKTTWHQVDKEIEIEGKRYTAQEILDGKAENHGLIIHKLPSPYL